MDNNRQNTNNKGNRRGGNNALRIILVTALIALIVMSFLRSNLLNNVSKELPYSEFMQMVENGDVEAVSIEDSEISIQVKKDAKNYSAFTEYYTVRMDEDPELINRLYKSGVEIRRHRSDTANILLTIASYFLPIAITLFFFSLLMRRSGGGGVDCAIRD